MKICLKYRSFDFPNASGMRLTLVFDGSDEKRSRMQHFYVVFIWENTLILKHECETETFVKPVNILRFFPKNLQFFFFIKSFFFLNQQVYGQLILPPTP